MNLLVTGAFTCTDEVLQKIRQMGHTLIFMQNEKDKLPCDYSEVEGVICNGLFLHHDIRKFSSLGFVQLTSAGYDRVPMEYIREKNIEIFNARGVYSIPMAEFALCGILSLYKNMDFFSKNQKLHKWEKNRSVSELFGKKVCIIGCGSVGYECAVRFKAFGTELCGVDLEDKNDALFGKIVAFKKAKENIAKSDIVIITAPLTEKTNRMFDSQMFSNFKEGAILVNIARGKIVDEKALIEALKTKLSGAVLDVFEEEPLCQSSPLWDMENVIITPHNSFVGEGNINRLTELVIKNLQK